MESRLPMEINGNQVLGTFKISQLKLGFVKNWQLEPYLVFQADEQLLSSKIFQRNDVSKPVFTTNTNLSMAMKTFPDTDSTMKVFLLNKNNQNMPIAEATLSLNEALNNGSQIGNYKLFSNFDSQHRPIGQIHFLLQWQASSIFSQPVLRPPSISLKPAIQGGLENLVKEGSNQHKRKKTYPEIKRKKLLAQKKIQLIKEKQQRAQMQKERVNQLEQQQKIKEAQQWMKLQQIQDNEDLKKQEQKLIQSQLKEKNRKQEDFMREQREILQKCKEQQIQQLRHANQRPQPKKKNFGRMKQRLMASIFIQSGAQGIQQQIQIDNKQLANYNQNLQVQDKLSQDWQALGGGNLKSSCMDFDQQVGLKKSIVNFQPKQKKTFEKFTRFNVHIDQVQKYYKILKAQRGNQQNFIDKNYRFGQKILSPNFGEFLQKKPTAGNYVWKRPTEWMKGNIQVFEGEDTSGIEPADILQGNLGDCYFLSSVSTLSEKPHLIKRLFLTRRFNKEGVYGIFLCDTGDWRLVIVDDFFPCISKNGGPAFSKGNGNELWVLLLEKAYSKIYGSYANIESGITLNALRDLTGAPGLTFKTAVENDTWHFLLANYKKGFVMTASSGDKYQGQNKTNSMGIVSNHAYAVLKVFLTKNGEKIVKLRNPWGDTEWKGNWKKDSQK